jgi:hypothetical protein
MKATEKILSASNKHPDVSCFSLFSHPSCLWIIRFSKKQNNTYSARPVQGHKHQEILMGSERILDLFIIKIVLLFYDKPLILHELDTNTNIIVCNTPGCAEARKNGAKNSLSAQKQLKPSNAKGYG